MAEYIKREDAMKALDEHRLSRTMSMYGDMEMLIEYRDGVIGAMNALAFVPTADVVPKSEVDLYRKQVDELEDELASTYDKLEKAKADVATEIFAEIEEMLNMQGKIVCKTRETAREADEPMLSWISELDGRIYSLQVVEEHIAELKKKYTEN